MPKAEKQLKHEKIMTKKKLPLGVWLSISNLILTGIIGIGVAIFLNIRNEYFQKQLVEIQKQNQFANISIVGFEPSIFSDNYLGGNIEVTNNGPAPAKNLILTICISTINKIWEKEITDINQFNISTLNAALITNKEYSSPCIANPFSNSDRNDSVTFEIATLGPNQSFQMIIQPSESIKYRTITTDVNGTITFPNKYLPTHSDQAIYSSFEQLLSKYFVEKYSMAKFYGGAICDNCVFLNSSVVYTSIMTLQEWSWKNEKITSQNESKVEASFDFSATYAIPPNYHDINETLNININQDGLIEAPEP